MTESYYQLIFETMLQGVVGQDSDGKIIIMNPAAENILGRSPNEFLGQTSVDQEWHTLRADGTPFPGLEHPAMVALRTGQTVRDVVMGVFNPRENAYRWISITAIPLFRPGATKPYQVYTFFSDITGYKRIEEENRSIAKFPAENPHPVLRISPEGVILYANEASEALLQKWDSHIGDPAPPVLVHETTDAFIIQMNKTIEIECYERVYSLTIVPIIDSDYINIYGTDITKRRRAEEILQMKQQELTSINERLQAQTRELNFAYQELQCQADEISNHIAAANQARNEAEHQAAELDATLSSIAMGVVIFDIFGNVVRRNDYAQKLLFLSPEDYNLSFYERCVKLKVLKWDGALYEKEETPLSKALQGEIIKDEEMMIAGNPDKPAWISATFAPIYDHQEKLIGVISVFTDITERKRKTEAILASERELLTVTINSLNEGVIAVDQEERIIFINKAAFHMVGRSQEEAIGQPLNKILYLIDHKTSKPIGQIPGTAFNHLILRTLDLREIPVSINNSPITACDGQIIGTVFVLEDITEKQKTEQELLKTAKLESLGILAGGVAHDFNNILAGILANIQMAKIKFKKQEDISKYLENTIETTHKARSLTKQLLTFAKGGDPVKKSVSIVNLVKDAVQFALSGSKVKAEFNFPEDLWAGDIDEGQITQVINNLTMNAEQAMPTGGILEIYGANIIIEASDQYSPGYYVRLTVKDQGIGIPEEIINKIFDPFFTTKKTGNGLGLSTSYSIIKKHNGYLKAESAPGIGATFYILLPASMKELAATESHREIAATGEAKILLMDDEDTIRNVGGEMLTCFGYQVTLAKDGQEAIKFFKKAMEAGEPFDMVIMDLTVPGGLGGIETMAILRRIDPEVKAIISSGYAGDPVMSDFERYGFIGVVTKPYKFDELNAILSKEIHRKQLPLGLTY